MSVKAIIDRIKPYSKGWSRPAILYQIQRGQDELLNAGTPYSHFISTDNDGFPPYLYTTDETYRYEIINANLSATLTQSIGGVDRVVRCKSINRVFVDLSENYDYGRKWLGEPFTVGFYSPYSSNNTRVNVAEIPCRKVPALENTPAYIDFIENPGTTTDIFFVEFLWEAPRLTAETIPLVVPQLYEEALEDYVLGVIEKRSNGKTGENLVRFYSGVPNMGILSWIDRFKTEDSAGADVGNSMTELIDC